MHTLIWFYVIITLLIATITSITLWSRKNIVLKGCTLFLAVTAILLSYTSLLELLGRAKPKHLEILNRYDGDITLLHVSWVEDEAIYLLVEIDELTEPRLYKFPWNAKQAQEFDEAMEAGRENGDNVKISNPFTSDTEDRKTMVYSTPAKPLPPKELPEPGITAYDSDADKKLFELKKEEYEKSLEND